MKSVFELSHDGIIVSPLLFPSFPWWHFCFSFTFSLFSTFPMFLLYRDLLLIVPKNTDETEDLHRLLPKYKYCQVCRWCHEHIDVRHCDCVFSARPPCRVRSSPVQSTLVPRAGDDFLKRKKLFENVNAWLLFTGCQNKKTVLMSSRHQTVHDYIN